MVKILGTYNNKLTDAPKRIGSHIDGVEEINIFPSTTDLGCISTQVQKDKIEIRILDDNDIVWRGTMEELIAKLKK